MATRITKALKAAVGGVFALAVASTGASAHEFWTNHTHGKNTVIIQQERVVRGERYTPTIWVDPDGCEHWVMDDGVEGYMTPHTNRKGIPVCRRGNVCGVMNSDQLFHTDSYRISSEGMARLRQFFGQAKASGYIIAGHTDSRASDRYNMRLSLNRANSVARVAADTGARIYDIRGYGERQPKVPNTSAANMAQNRRVEIICVR